MVLIGCSLKLISDASLTHDYADTKSCNRFVKVGCEVNMNRDNLMLLFCKTMPCSCQWMPFLLVTYHCLFKPSRPLL
ncbi:hypothetical protein T05_2720 [Trichinella murrelli]|uniref:Uncharacterized protein n=1 Tax=Trichinella murrelli TaxID=144512 RepID=A0A0V0TZN0_9BILA|nr:hypothetical protein T05_2720 [Trichinella murrelli]